MHTVELLEAALDLAGRLGYSVRQEWLGGGGGGVCELRGRKTLFLDLDQGPAEQLDRAVQTLRSEPEALRLPMSAELAQLLRLRKIA
jgi:hypothetical protein